MRFRVLTTFFACVFVFFTLVQDVSAKDSWIPADKTITDLLGRRSEILVGTNIPEGLEQAGSPAILVSSVDGFFMCVIKNGVCYKLIGGR